MLYNLSYKSFSVGIPNAKTNTSTGHHNISHPITARSAINRTHVTTVSEIFGEIRLLEWTKMVEGGCVFRLSPSTAHANLKAMYSPILPRGWSE